MVSHHVAFELLTSTVRDVLWYKLWISKGDTASLKKLLSFHYSSCLRQMLLNNSTATS